MYLDKLIFTLFKLSPINTACTCLFCLFLFKVYISYLIARLNESVELN